MVGDDGDLLYVTVGRCLLSEDFEKEMKAATREKMAEKKKKGKGKHQKRKKPDSDEDEDSEEDEPTVPEKRYRGSGGMEKRL